MKSDLLSAPILKVTEQRQRGWVEGEEEGIGARNEDGKQEEEDRWKVGEKMTHLAPITSLNGSCLSIQFNDFSSQPDCLTFILI